MKANIGSSLQLSGPATPSTTRRPARMEHRPSRSFQGNADGESGATPTGRALFVIPTRRGDGFRASIRGHMLELADPTDDRLAPSPHDLLVASIASDAAWSARRFLRARGLPDDVSVSARWRTREDLPGPADINLTVTVSSRAEAVRAALAAALEKRRAAGPLAGPVVHISLGGVSR